MEILFDQCEHILMQLRAMANPKNVEGMARFGINPHNTLGISIPPLRKMARNIGRNQDIAECLWQSGIHEARILATFIVEPKKVKEELLESWVADFDSWDVCDQACCNLFIRTPFAYNKAVEWTFREEEFVRRAGFAMIAQLAVHDKKAADERFIELLPHIVRGATDERNFVKKAVNWSLRQIGKRNPLLREIAMETAREIQKIGIKPARWIAADALRELEKRS